LLIYWIMFGYFAVGALVGASRDSGQRRLTPMLIFGALGMTILIGFRYQVGGDWTSYLEILEGRGAARNIPVNQDTAYQFVNWLAQQGGLEIWAVNLLCGAIFTWGLFRFSLAQAEPWLALTVAIPYMVIVVAMGYTRQAVALGILMGGIAAVERGATIPRFSIYTLFATLFHRTAVVVLPLIAFAKQPTRLSNILVGLAAAVLLYDFFLGNSVDLFIKNYVHSGYSSSGAGVRLAMNVVPALFLLVANRRLQFDDQQWNIWRNFALASLILLLFLFISPSSTAVDRMSLYVMPLQLAVLSRVPVAVKPEALARLAVILYMAAVQFTWLNTS
jgi:hypothetical protein